MSLIVLAFHIDPNTCGTGADVWPDEAGAELAGFEDMRYWLWSNPVLTRRGATYLPQLSNNDLFVYPDDLNDFESECQMILANAKNIAQELAPEAVQGLTEGIQFRVNNFLKAINTAREIKGGVYIG